MTEVWFTGCEHFDHANIIRLAGRPFRDVDEMNAEMVRRHNEVVGDADTVYHLGDFAWYNAQQWMRELRGGQHIVLLGNHDSGEKLREAAEILGDGGGDYESEDYVSRRWRINRGGPYLELNLRGQQLVLCHYPIEDWNGRWRGSIHLHCHDHLSEMRNPLLPRVVESGLDMGPPSRYPPEQRCNRFRVGVDATDFRPVSLTQILAESRR